MATATVSQGGVEPLSQARASRPRPRRDARRGSAPALCAAGPAIGGCTSSRAVLRSRSAGKSRDSAASAPVRNTIWRKAQGLSE